MTSGIKVTGRLQNPQLDLFSIPAMGQTDTLSYLILGRPMDGASASEGEVVAKAALALGLAGGDSNSLGHGTPRQSGQARKLAAWRLLSGRSPATAP